MSMVHFPRDKGSWVVACIPMFFQASETESCWVLSVRMKMESFIRLHNTFRYLRDHAIILIDVLFWQFEQKSLSFQLDQTHV